MTQETTTKTGFTCTRNKGFQMTFENGLTISVQWGEMNYCSMRHLEVNKETNHNGLITSPDSEIAIWDSNGEWFSFGSDTVKGWCSPDEIGYWIHYTMTSKNLLELKQKAKELL